MRYQILYPLLALLFILSTTNFATAQFRKVIHNTFEVGETEEINLDLAGDVEYESWSGNVIMTEITVFLGNASASMLNHFVEEGRYDVMASDPDSTVVMIITSETKDRAPAKLRRWVDTGLDKKELKEIDVDENVYIKVFMPEEYEAQDEAKTVWKRKVEAPITDSIKKDSVRTKSGFE
ncbi:MAG: hypothetical protein AAF847_19310 [Bacteroidota bacterium]